MTKYAASRRCSVLWGHLGTPFIRLRRKSVTDRCEVGYLVAWPNNFVHIMGTGPTWEVALERAQKEQR